MASDFRPAGVFVPMVTPFGADGSVDLACLEELTAGVIADGASGVVALATTGEPHMLDEAERLEAEALLELAATENVAGVKQAVGGIDADTLAVLAESAGRFAMLGGDDAFLFPLVLMGATGAIAASSHLCTRRFVEMIECGRSGAVVEGRAHAEALLPLVRALFAEPSPAVIKAALHLEGRIPTPDVRMPMSPASPEAVERVRAALAGASSDEFRGTARS